jgi:hypothetical protein
LDMYERLLSGNLLGSERRKQTRRSERGTGERGGR